MGFIRLFSVVGLFVGLLLGVGASLFVNVPTVNVAGKASVEQGLPLEELRLPEGYEVSLYARLPGARSMVLGPDATLFVGTRDEGKVYAARDEDGDGVAEKTWTLAEGLDSPNGVAVRDGALYVAEISRVLRYDDIESSLAAPPQPVVINDDFPDDPHHGWKFIAFGPDDKLYVPVGAPCNVCKPEERLFATITRMNPDGSGLEVYASGVRNTVGFDWNPATNELWFTDNGRDLLGENTPPDELNHAPRKGMHFGFPACHGTDVRDPRFGGLGCSTFTPPVVELGPHVAALGMRFYEGDVFPGYDGHLFIAEHGSWNREVPIGYRVMTVDPAAGSYEAFAEGWLRENGEAWGRPVDVQQLPDGSLLVSDDRAGAVYRIAYTG